MPSQINLFLLKNLINFVHFPVLFQRTAVGVHTLTLHAIFLVLYHWVDLGQEILEPANSVTHNAKEKVAPANQRKRAAVQLSQLEMQPVFVSLSTEFQPKSNDLGQLYFVEILSAVSKW